MTEPTDAGPSLADQLFSLIRFFGYTTHGQTAEIVDAIVAKWGTPPAVAGGIKWQCGPQATAFGGCPSCGSKSCIARQCTTPQPTQAQAGAVPLTNARLQDISLNYSDSEDECTGFRDGWRAAEKHYGIKGGQHGPS